MNKKILIEASGSPVSAFMIKAIQSSNNIAVASDISSDCAAKVLANEFCLFPREGDESMWEKVENSVLKKEIDIIIPSFDGMLLGWAERKEFFSKHGVKVMISPPETIETFSDKWNSALFFAKHDFPCASSSLNPIYPLVKPRFGRGSSGVFIEFDENKRAAKFKSGDISQSILTGDEYTVDCLFDHNGRPIYIIPRKRFQIQNGKSMGGITVKNQIIEELIISLSKAIEFHGPINIQFFVNGEEVNILEINPRIAGGMALGFAASENWVPRVVDICNSDNIDPINIKWSLKMYRAYEEFFVL